MLVKRFNVRNLDVSGLIDSVIYRRKGRIEKGDRHRVVRRLLCLATKIRKDELRFWTSGSIIERLISFDKNGDGKFITDKNCRPIKGKRLFCARLSLFFLISVTEIQSKSQLVSASYSNWITFFSFFTAQFVLSHGIPYKLLHYTLIKKFLITNCFAFIIPGMHERLLLTLWNRKVKTWKIVYAGPTLGVSIKSRELNWFFFNVQKKASHEV